jgi:hypothetical protein
MASIWLLPGRKSRKTSTDDTGLAKAFLCIATISGGNLIEMLTNGSATVTLTFDDFSGSLNFAYSGGNTLITDPPPTPAVNPVVSIGGPGGTEMYDPSATNTADSPAVASTATASDDCGTVTVAGAGPADALSTTVVPQGSNDPGSLSAGAVAESNSNASVTWRFGLGNDQIDFAPGQTVTQSCEVTASDPQNPAETVTETTSVSIGGSGNDQFIFKPGVGADTIVNFNPHDDINEPDHFADAQTVQQLSSLITSEAHGNAMIELGHNDSVTIPGVTQTYLQAHLEALVRLFH